LRLTNEQADRMTLNEILIMHLADHRRREEQLANTRLIMWEIRTKYLKRGKKISPKDIFALQSEKEPIKIISKEDYRKLKQMWSN